MAYERAKQKAHEVLQEYEKKHGKKKSYDLDIIACANSAGFEVYEDNLEENVSGLILISDDLKNRYGSNKVIIINSNHSALRKRFTVAHELAHYFLDFTDGEKQYVAYRDIQNGRTDKEIDADWFAGELLMPEEEVKEALEKYERNSDFLLTSREKIRFISTLFLVSEPTAKAKLDIMGLI